MARKTLAEILNGKTRFGRLTIISEVRGNYVPANGTYRRAVVCACDCGNKKTIELQQIKSGATKSCGCLNIQASQERSTKHGHSALGKRTAEYQAWKDAKSRCYNPNVRNYHEYGGRGIRMCDQWRHSFEAFIADMGMKPTPDHSIDRWPDNDGNYEPGNCRWATDLQQGNNRRRGRHLVYKGKSYSCSEAAREFGIKQHTLAKRLRDGWPVDEAIETPLQPGVKRLG